MAWLAHVDISSPGKPCACRWMKTVCCWRKAVSRTKVSLGQSREGGNVRALLTCGPGKRYAESTVRAGSHMWQLILDCRSSKHSQQRPTKKPHAANARWKRCPHLANSLGPRAAAMESGQSPRSLIGKQFITERNTRDLVTLGDLEIHLPRALLGHSLMWTHISGGPCE